MSQSSAWALGSLGAAALLHATGFWTSTGVGATPAPQAQTARYEITLKFEKISGAHGGPDACPTAKRNGSDVLSGIVEGSETFVGGGITYTGTLARKTNLEYCETWRAPGTSEDKWCVPILVGEQARVETTINIYDPKMNQDAEIEYKPLISKTDSVAVKGACTSDMELGIVQEYLEPEAFTINPRNQSSLARLVEKGSWQDVKPRPNTQPDGWTLTVLRKLQ